MARRAAPPSHARDRATDAGAPPARKPERRRPAGRPVDVQGWLGGIRLSGFMVIMLGLVVLAAFILVPTVGTYIDQRQRIAALEQSVELTQQQVDELEREQDRWSDPAYITTQARERLYYMKPGEVVYLVDNDLATAEQPQTEKPVSDELERTDTDWMSQFVRSVASAGVAVTARAPLTIGVPDEPASTSSPTPAG